MAWYITHGKYKVEDFANMGYIEKTILHYSRYEYYKEEEAKFKALGGGMIG